MILKLSLVIAMCSGVHFADVQKKVSELQKQNPGAIVSYRIDQKAVCANGQILTGKEAKLMQTLGK